MTTPARRILDRAMTEAQLQRLVIDTAHAHGWLAHHAARVQDSRGVHRTAIQGDAGAPDLLLARGGRVLNVELKREAGRLSPAQEFWQLAIGATHRLWRPRDIDEVIATLAAG